jgi:hypothetical protein
VAITGTTGLGVFFLWVCLCGLGYGPVGLREWLTGTTGLGMFFLSYYTGCASGLGCSPVGLREWPFSYPLSCCSLTSPRKCYLFAPCRCRPSCMLSSLLGHVGMSFRFKFFICIASRAIVRYAPYSIRNFASKHPVVSSECPLGSRRRECHAASTPIRV